MLFLSLTQVPTALPVNFPSTSIFSPFPVCSCKFICLFNSPVQVFLLFIQSNSSYAFFIISFIRFLSKACIGSPDVLIKYMCVFELINGVKISLFILFLYALLLSISFLDFLYCKNFSICTFSLLVKSNHLSGSFPNSLTKSDSMYLSSQTISYPSFLVILSSFASILSLTKLYNSTCMISDLSTFEYMRLFAIFS